MPSTFRTRPVALGLARRDWPVLPCHHANAGRCSCGDADCTSVGKHPRTRHGLHQATTDARTIRGWWRQWPDANVGVRTGAAPAGAGVIVVDIDPAHGGEESLARLEREHGALPATLEAATGGGGRHLWFAHPGITVPNSAGRVGAGIDVRGDGGYVLVSPSRHASGGGTGGSKHHSSRCLRGSSSCACPRNRSSPLARKYRRTSAPGPERLSTLRSRRCATASKACATTRSTEQRSPSASSSAAVTSTKRMSSTT